LGDNNDTLPCCKVVSLTSYQSLSKEHYMAKEKDKIIKTTKTMVIMEHPTYSDDKLVGWAKSTLFRETQDGLSALRANLTMSHLKDINRQIKTDDKNNLRRGTSMFAALRQLAKSNPIVAQLLEVLLKEAQEGKVNANTLKEIESLVKAA
jgi:hypothetical protein